MKYAVLGAGAVGASIAAHLFMAGQEVFLIDPGEARVNAVRQDGLRLSVKRDDGVFRPVTLPVPIVAAPNGSEKADVVILATKSIYNLSALDSIHSLWRENTILLTCQNGADTLAGIRETLPEGRCAVGVVYFGGRIEPDGLVTSLMGGDAHLWVSEGNPRTEPVLRRMAEELEASGFHMKLCPREAFAVIFWKKLILNVVAGSLCALQRITNDQLRASESGVTLSCLLAEECCRVAKAVDGVTLKPEEIPLLAVEVKPIIEGSFQHYPSMAADAMAGRRTENEYFAGALCRMAKRHGVNAPRLEMLYEMCRLMETYQTSITRKGKI